MAVETQTDARRAALERLIDHAALFPPTSMSMDDALAEDRRVRKRPEEWLVHRFVCPLSQLVALGDEPVRLSVVLDEDPDERLDDPRVEAVELPPGRDADGVAGRGLEVYVERPLNELSWLDAVAAGGRRGKARCGGATVPSVERLAAFVRRCRELGVPFKATAGLHHAVRRPGEHGFLNLLAAAVFPGAEEAALADEAPVAFNLAPGIFAWRDRAAGAAEVAEVRRRLFVGLGSCSVQEPVDELEALGILPA